MATDPLPPVHRLRATVRPPHPYNLAAALGLSHLVRLHLMVFGVGLLLCAASLQWQPEEWMSPVYGVLFSLLSPSAWAVILVLVAVVKFTACILYPRLVPAALVVGTVLLVYWGTSFTAAYVTGDFSPAAPLLALMTAFVIGEHFAVATLVQRERGLNGATADLRGADDHTADR